METIEALEIKGRPYRYRAIIRWGEGAAGMPLCTCRQGHASKEEALICPQALSAMPPYLRKDLEESEKKLST